MSQPSINQLFTEPRYLGNYFGGESWSSWRTIGRAISAMKARDGDEALFCHVAGNRPWPTKPVRELWAFVGRRGGKDSFASGIATYMAVTFKSNGRLRPGEKAIVACVAFDRTQAKIIHSYISAYFSEVPAFKQMVVRETHDSIELDNGVIIRIVTSDFRSLRGQTFLCVIADEICLWRDPDTGNLNVDQEIYRSIKPGLHTLIDAGALFIAISSVHGRRGLAYEMWSKHYGKDSDRILVLHAPSMTFNPTLSQEEIDDAIERDPAAGRADYLSVWRDDLQTFIPRDLIEAAVDRGVKHRPWRSGVRYQAFGDLSEGTPYGDSSAAAIAHREGDQQVLDWSLEIKPPFDAGQMVQQIAFGLKSYHINELMLDDVSQGFAKSEFARHGIVTVKRKFKDVKTRELINFDKSDIYLAMLPRFTARRVRLLDDDRLVNQICNLERRPMPGGGERVGHPRGLHDDLSDAVCGALLRAAQADGWMSIPPANRQRALEMSRVPAPRNRYGKFNMGGGLLGNSMSGFVRSGAPTGTVDYLNPSGQQSGPTPQRLQGGSIDMLNSREGK